LGVVSLVVGEKRVGGGGGVPSEREAVSESMAALAADTCACRGMPV
jgi:hypothetical protein